MSKPYSQPGEKGTDTNQASEDILIELATKFDMDEYGTVNENGGYLIGEVRKLIRTEKLKLLAEVRERVVGESFKPSGFDERHSRQEGDNGHITHYETKKDAETINQHQEYQRTELTKLEAEL